MGKTWRIWWSGRTRPVRRGGRCLPGGKGCFWVRRGGTDFLLDFLPWKGICVRWRGRGWVGDWPPLSIGTHYERPTVKKKSAKGAGDEGKHLAPVESAYFADLLPLVEHCCCRKYDDNDPREPGWITIKTQGAAWCVQVKDPDSAMSFTAVGQSLDKALETAALLLGCDEAPWEPDAWLAKKGSQKGKK